MINFINIFHEKISVDTNRLSPHFVCFTYNRIKGLQVRYR